MQGLRKKHHLHLHQGLHLHHLHHHGHSEQIYLVCHHSQNKKVKMNDLLVSPNLKTAAHFDGLILARILGTWPILSWGARHRQRTGNPTFPATKQTKEMCGIQTVFQMRHLTNPNFDMKTEIIYTRQTIRRD